MDFGKLASLSIGLAAFLGGLWIVLQILKLRRNNHVKPPPLVIGSQPPRIATAGEQSADYWQARFQSLESKMDTIQETLERIERKQ